MSRILSVAAAAILASAITNPEEYVNTLGGTDSRYDLSHGNLLPLVSRPWSFNTWAPQTDNDASYSSWWFHPTDVRLFGIRCTHQPSPWISDYGNFRIMASITDPAHSDPWQYSSYDPTAATFKPYLFNASLLAYGTTAGNLNIEVTSTNHGAMMRVRFPPYVTGEVWSGFNQTRRILVALDRPFSDKVTVNTSSIPAQINGYATSNSGGVAPNFAHYFALTVEPEGQPDSALPIVPTVSTNSGTLYAAFDMDPSNPISDSLIVRVATSLISPAQAATNLASELPPSLTFDQAVNASKMEWRQTLLQANIVDVGAGYSPDQQAAFLETFYSSMYRAAQFPRMLSETGPNGTEVHWSPFDPQGRVFPGPLSTDSGFWDAYRTVYPLTSILHPAQTGRTMQGWVNGYQEGGWLAKWASPGYRGSMVGTMGDVSLADAIVKNISGFDHQTAYAAIRQDAFVVPPPTGVGRECLQAYLDNGYIPYNAPSTTGGCYEEVSRTQNYWLADFAIAQAAKSLGYAQDAAILSARAANYSNLFEPSTGFFRTRNAGSGSFVEPFDQFAWKGPYTEAGAWQYRFYVPHDPKGLASLYSKAAGQDMCSVLEAMQTMPSTFHVGGYGDIIHEQTEMALNCYGQYEHNNQPVHHVQYMFIAMDESVTGACAAKGQYWLRQTMTRLYQPGPAMFCGDEDNGEVAAWYLLSSMGLYALAPGTPDYVLGSPLFAHVQVPLPNGKILDITASNQSMENVYVQGVTWNGQPITGVTIPYGTLMQGGTLAFTMGPNPANASTSASTSSKAAAGSSRLRSAGHR